MSRFSTFVAVVGCAGMLQIAASAQEPVQKTRIETEHGKLVTYTGCIQNAPDARTYILDKAEPASRSETTQTVGTTGEVTTTTTTTYQLIPEEKVELAEHVGHKVEVTGVLIEAGHGDAKITEKTKTEGEHEQKTKTEIERTSHPQFRVVSVKPLGSSC